MAVDQSVEMPITIQKFGAVFTVVSNVCFADPLSGDPWIHFCNGDLELYLFYYIKT